MVRLMGALQVLDVEGEDVVGTGQSRGSDQAHDVDAPSSGIGGASAPDLNAG